MSAEQPEPGKLPVRLVIAMLAVIMGATALIVGLTRTDTAESNLPSDAVRQGGIAVYGAYVREPATNTAAAYFAMTNVGDSTDTLVAVSSPVSTSAMLHDVGKDELNGTGGMDSGSMTPTPEVELEPGETVTLAPTAGHMMLEGVSGTLEPGSTVNLHLVFENAGTITVKAHVIALTDPAPTS
ncbi:MAG: copper chaperone PCu(A)C [Cumulibacter sp.]